MPGERTYRTTNPSDRQIHAGLAVLLAVVLFSAVAVARVLVTGAHEPITSLYVLPIALVAVRFGRRAGVLSALLAVVLSGVSREAADITVTPITVGVWFAVFVP